MIRIEEITEGRFAGATYALATWLSHNAHGETKTLRVEVFGENNTYIAHEDKTYPIEQSVNPDDRLEELGIVKVIN